MRKHCRTYCLYLKTYRQRRERCRMGKALSCYINMKRYNEALATLDTITLHFPDYENGTLKGPLFSIKWTKPRRLCNYICLPSSRATRICVSSTSSDTRNWQCPTSKVHGSRSYEESIRRSHQTGQPESIERSWITVCH